MHNLSACCQAEVTVSEGEEGTSCFVCSKCNLPAELYMPTTKNKTSSKWTSDDNGKRVREVNEKYVEKPTKNKGDWKKEITNIIESFYLDKGYGIVRWHNEDLEITKKVLAFISFQLQMVRKEALTEAINIFERHKDEPMTGNVVILELANLRGDYDNY